MSDSLQTSFDFNKEKLDVLSKKAFNHLHKEEIDYLITASIYKRDHGNYELYQYLKIILMNEY